MPSYLAAEGILCTKMVTFYQRAQGSSLPSTQATLLLFDPEHGHVTAVRHKAHSFLGKTDCLHIVVCTCLRFTKLPSLSITSVYLKP